VIGVLRAVLGALAMLALTPAFAAAQPERAVAVTIDDLPFAHGGQGCTEDGARTFTAEFLAMLSREGVPAVGFANPGRGCGEGPADPRLLEAWLDAGFELGSHSNTHPDINDIGLVAYEADVVAAESVLRPMLERRGGRLVWYRHPYLRTGATEQIRGGMARFLAGRGYRVAPVTFDNSEWIYAAVYARALARGDAAEARRIGEAYVEHMREITAFFEARSNAILGREPPQVLLIHANLLNRDWFPKVKAMLASRGYRFVSLEEATRDPAYAKPDILVGRYGMSWILRWGLLDGAPVVREPDPPAWVDALYRAGGAPRPTVAPAAK